MADALEAQSANLQPSSENKLIAPLWHTILLIVILLGLSAFSYFTSREFVMKAGPESAPPSAARLVTYAATLVQEWLLFWFVLWGWRKGAHSTVRQQIAVRPEKDALIRDIGIAAAAWGAAAIVNGILNLALHPKGISVILQLVPHTAAELALWIPLAASAGFCEEYIFRGYFQQQFGALTRSVWAGVFFQAVFFGLGHGYQGAASMFGIFCLGLIFGIVAKLSKSLRPTMIAHGWTDFFAGVIGYMVFLYHLKLPVS
jgi:uncharacterized protein